MHREVDVLELVPGDAGMTWALAEVERLLAASESTYAGSLEMVPALARRLLGEEVVARLDEEWQGGDVPSVSVWLGGQVGGLYLCGPNVSGIDPDVVVGGEEDPCAADDEADLLRLWLPGRSERVRVAPADFGGAEGEVYRYLRDSTDGPGLSIPEAVASVGGVLHGGDAVERGTAREA